MILSVAESLLPYPVDWELTFKAIAAVGIPVGLILTWWTHSQRTTFEMIDRMYSLCHTLQGHALREWRLSHLYCIGSDVYDETRRRIADATSNDLDRVRLSVEEREFATHILIAYEQVYYQWKHSRSISVRRRFLESMLSYFVDRLLRNPRIVGLIATDPSGCTFHLEAESMQFLKERWARSAPVVPDLDGPFASTAFSVSAPTLERLHTEAEPHLMTALRHPVL